MARDARTRALLDANLYSDHLAVYRLFLHWHASAKRPSFGEGVSVSFKAAGADSAVSLSGDAGRSGMGGLGALGAALGRISGVSGGPVAASAAAAGVGGSIPLPGAASSLGRGTSTLSPTLPPASSSFLSDFGFSFSYDDFSDLGYPSVDMGQIRGAVSFKRMRELGNLVVRVWMSVRASSQMRHLGSGEGIGFKSMKNGCFAFVIDADAPSPPVPLLIAERYGQRR